MEAADPCRDVSQTCEDWAFNGEVRDTLWLPGASCGLASRHSYWFVPGRVLPASEQ